MNAMRLVVLDIDGCLTAGEAKPWNFSLMEFIAQLNQRARVDSNQFAVTLCTGRPEPYVEAIMQAIDGHMPAIYENGGGLYFPSPYHFAENPAITRAMRATLREIRAVLQQTIIEKGIAQIQPGKEVSITLYPSQSEVTLTQLAERVQHTLAGRLAGYTVHASVSCVEVLPQSIDKGAGVEWLARETGIPLAQMGGIGDAPSDLSYLKKVGHAATTANARAEVKAAVQYASPFVDSFGTLDILRRWVK